MFSVSNSTSTDARAYALRLLGGRSYTIRNLRRKLQQKNFDAREIDATVSRLIDTGVLNDTAYALQFARTKLTTGSASMRRIKQALQKKGVDSAVAESAVRQVIVDEEIDTDAVLEKVARKKFLMLSGLEERVVRQRLFGFLARRGYDLDEIKRMVERLV